VQAQTNIYDTKVRYSPEGLLERYAAGRVAHFWQRPGLTVIGAVALAVLISPLIGLLAAVTALVGETVDCTVLKSVLKDVKEPERFTHNSQKATISAAFQATSIAVCVFMAWFGSPGQSAEHFCVAFLASAALNSGIVWPFHPPSAKARLTIYALTATLALGVTTPWAEGATPEQAFNFIGHGLIAYVVYVILKHVIRNHTKHRLKTEHILNAAAELEAAHVKLTEAQKTAHRLSMVARHANDSVIISGSDGKIVWVNQAFVSITGYESNEAIGRMPGELFNGPDTDMDTVAQIGDAIAKGEPFRGEILNYRKDGQQIWVETNQVPVAGRSGTEDMVIAIERDITALKQHEAELATAKEKAEAGERTKSDFLATMSHEIRTPMNGIIGLSDLLAHCDLDGDARNYATTIRSSGEALLTIINDILDYSKLDAGQVTIELQEFDLPASLNDVINLFAEQAAQNDMFIDVIDDANLPDRVVGDAGRIRQILINIIGNAIKFTERGGVTIRTGLTETQDGLRISFAVTDTGIGIEAEQTSSIFEKFSQADSQTTRKFGGTGLGLSISRLLARRMGGDITVTSRAGVGSTFTITLVVQPAEGLEPRSAPTHDVVDIGPMSVLVAEDNKTNRFLIGKYLKDSPVDLRFAENGKIAVDEVSAALPDVVFMDMSMPEMDGLEATRKIRARPGPQPHIIALTANAFASDRAACLDAGMDDFLAKPVRRAEILSKLAHVNAAQKKARASKPL